MIVLFSIFVKPPLATSFIIFYIFKKTLFKYTAYVSKFIIHLLEENNKYKTFICRPRRTIVHPVRRTFLSGVLRGKAPKPNFSFIGKRKKHP